MFIHIICSCCFWYFVVIVIVFIYIWLFFFFVLVILVIYSFFLWLLLSLLILFMLFLLLSSASVDWRWISTGFAWFNNQHLLQHTHRHTYTLPQTQALQFIYVFFCRVYLIKHLFNRIYLFDSVHISHKDYNSLKFIKR